MQLNDKLNASLALTTTRRTIVKTGVKLAYAAPLVAATMKLSASGALASISGTAGTCTADSRQGQTDGGYDPCGSTSNGNPCVCARAGSRTVCSAYGACDRPCNTDADCAIVTGFYGDTAPGYCHTDTYCGHTGYTGACAPLCQ